MSLLQLSLKQASLGLKKGEFTATELTQAYIQRIESHRFLNAYITETFDQALAQAKVSDTHFKNRSARPLEGIPLGIKDLFCTKGVRTTAGSKMLESFVPFYESTVTQKLFDAGGIMLGKLNMDEFAMGSSNLTSAYGPVLSPWKNKNHPDWNLVPGGSSGGSATAIAAGLALGVTGTDTGGSIRQPAAFCGIVGIKPTYGLCSRYGLIAFASSLDQAGPIARTVEDTALLLQVMAGHDPLDSTSSTHPIPDYTADIKKGVQGLRIGIPDEYKSDEIDPAINALWEQGKAWLQEAGAEIYKISLPHTAQALPTYYILAPAEASSNLARYDGVRYGLRIPGSTLEDMYEKTRSAGFGKEVKRRILVGTYVLSSGFYEAYYRKAQKVRALVTQDFHNAFKKIDLILTPTTPNGAFAIGQEPKDPKVMYFNDVYTVSTNLAGLPAISVPGGLSADGLPLGLQLIGPAFSERTLFQAAYTIEKAAGFQLPIN